MSVQPVSGGANPPPPTTQSTDPTTLQQEWEELIGASASMLGSMVLGQTQQVFANAKSNASD